MHKRFVIALVCLLAAFAFPGCAKKSGPATAADSDAPVEGVEKVKPAPGTGNVQGKVLYNNAPVENINVRLCETFSRFLNGCSVDLQRQHSSVGICGRHLRIMPVAHAQSNAVLAMDASVKLSRPSSCYEGTRLGADWPD